MCTRGMLLAVPCPMPILRVSVMHTAAVCATALGLLATTNPNPVGGEPLYHYTLEVTAPGVQLPASEPSQVVRVTLRALELAPNGEPTTTSAMASLVGELTWAGEVPQAADAGVSRFVRVSSSGTGTPSSQRVITEFNLNRSLEFSGDCTTLADPALPCEAVLDVQWEREDGGTLGEDITVSWGLVVTTTILQAGEGQMADGAENVVLELPWEVTFEVL